VCLPLLFAITSTTGSSIVRAFLTNIRAFVTLTTLVITLVTISFVAVSPITSCGSMLSTISLLTSILSSRGLISLRLRNLNLFDFGIRPHTIQHHHSYMQKLNAYIL
jgi:hypothetical protein